MKMHPYYLIARVSCPDEFAETPTYCAVRVDEKFREEIMAALEACGHVWRLLGDIAHSITLIHEVEWYDANAIEGPIDIIDRINTSSIVTTIDLVPATLEQCPDVRGDYMDIFYEPGDHDTLIYFRAHSKYDDQEWTSAGIEVNAILYGPQAVESVNWAGCE